MRNAEAGFLAPGSDGEVVAETGLWRKGLVYTTRRALAPGERFGRGYRISVGFKKGVSGTLGRTGFQDVYERVAAVARYRIAEMRCPDTGEAPGSVILGQTWGPLGANIATSLITFCLRCPGENGAEGEARPTEEALRLPGGATVEELERLAPQRADEVFNEFDFIDPASPNRGPITLSYGEPASGGETGVDFGPFVERAEGVALGYHRLLQTLGEATAQPLRIRHRAWFLASRTFVTVHVCFDP